MNEKKKKRGLIKAVRVALFSLIALLLLTSMLITSMIGNVKAEYFKTISKDLTLEMTPDVAFRYSISAYVPSSNKVLKKNGVYEDTTQIKQTFAFAGKTGSGVIYHIAIPVAEAGTYTLNFTYDMIQNGNEATDFYTNDLNNPVGCQITDGDYSSAENFNIADYYRIPNPEIGTEYNNIEADKDNSYQVGPDRGQASKYKSYMFASKPTFNADGNYQWKTVAPARAEHVSLTFKVNDSDVTKGYVLWEWDFFGLPRKFISTSEKYTEYELLLTNISYEKLDEVENAKAYFDFTETVYKNNAIIPTFQSSSNVELGKDTSAETPTRADNSDIGTYIQGHNISGITRENGGRGTYVTEASYNSMTMQAEPVWFAFNHGEDVVNGNTFTNNKIEPIVNSDDSYKKGGTYDYSNPIVFSVPLKNVKKNTTYKVTFDFSVARQGTKNVFNEEQHAQTNKHYQTSAVSDARYADYSRDFCDFFANDNYTDMNFQSFLCGPVNEGYSVAAQNTDAGRNYYYFADKNYNNHLLTNYDNITNTVTSLNTKSYAIMSNYFYDVNAASKTLNNVTVNNYLNAIKHIEYNEQNSICWLTFSNTSFSFNINGSKAEGKTYSDYGIIDTLHWTWCIDALQPSAWFRIKIDNVRIEEVVQYGSQISGVRIGTNAVTPFGTLFRGANGTGQNFLPRNYESGITQAALNVYAPVYNMDDHYVNSAERLKLYLSGFCVVEGGVDKYVWSADNGKTWHDMLEASPPGTATSVQITQAKYKVDSCVYGNGSPSTSVTNYKSYSNFTVADDGAKANFSSYNIYADLSEYAHQHDIDIIFAAVPIDNPSLRCEILRLINYGETRNYASRVDNIMSDIEVITKGTALSTASHSKESIFLSKGLQPNTFTPVSGLGVYNYYDAASDVKGTGGITESIVRKASRIDYDRLDVLYSDIPIKTTLKLSGGIGIHGIAVEKFVYSVDGGKTWADCTQASREDIAYTAGSNAEGNDYEKMLYYWISNNAGIDKNYLNGRNGRFNTASTYINVDLSEYVGKVVDVIVAAKPTGYYSYCPVARIDNVAVYGNPTKGDADSGVKGAGMGPFYTRISSVKLNGTLVKQITNNLAGEYFCGASQWNSSLHATSYSSYEPYHVDIWQARMYNNSRNAITAEGTVSIDGFITCKGGIAKYKYSIDGGEWQDIDSSSVAAADTAIINAGKCVDASLDITADGAKTNFFSSHGGTPLSFNLPAGVTGNRNLLVVAESNNGYLYPVVHIPLVIS